MADYDSIVIGGGHNGLTTSLFLAKRGLKVLNLEKTDVVGGLGSNVSHWPGHTSNRGAFFIFIQMQRVLDELELDKYGFEYMSMEEMCTYISSPDEPAFSFYSDPERLRAHIAETFGQEAMKGFVGLLEYLQPFGLGLQQAVFNKPISMGQMIDMTPSLEGKNAMRKLFYRPVTDILDEFFPKAVQKEAKTLMAMICAWTIDAFYGSPSTPGSCFNLAFHLGMPGDTRPKLVKGGIGNYSKAIKKAVEANGGEVRLNSPVKKLLIENNKAVGVELESGEKITADIVSSNCSARYTFSKLVGAENLPEQFMKMVNEIKYRNPYAQMYFRLKGLPEFTGKFAHLNESNMRWNIVFNPGLQGTEDAWDNCKNGKLSDTAMGMGVIPTIFDRTLAPEGEHNCTFFYMGFPVDAPREDWARLGEEALEKVMDEYSKYAPNWRDIVIDKKVFTPADYEARFNCDGGDLSHGTFSLDQMLDFRPVVGYTDHTTPVDNFYLCGSCCHPGWGLTSIPGLNCANKILKDYKK